MSKCMHTKLTVLRTSTETRVRCRACHLTITEAELAGGYCPECYEGSGAKRYEFEPVAQVNKDPPRLRCEDCALIIDVQAE